MAADSANRRPRFAFLSLAFLLIAAAWVLAGHWYRSTLMDDQRSRVELLLASYSHHISSALNLRMGQIPALVVLVRSEIQPDLRGKDEEIQQRMESYLAVQQEQNRGIRNLALAPGGIVRYIAPLTENREALGHNLLKDQRPGVRDKVLSAIETRRLILSDPYELLQGGLALVARQAIFEGDRFWGMATMAIDIPPILEEAGLLFPEIPLDVALRADSGKIFYGDADIAESDPVVVPVPLLDGAWALLGRPAGGWEGAVGDDLALFRLGTAALGGLLFGSLLLLFREKTVSFGFRSAASDAEHRREGVPFLVRSAWLVPLLFSVALALAGFSLHRYLAKLDLEDRRFELSRSLERTAGAIRTRLSTDLNYLSLLAREKSRGVLDEGTFQTHVSRYVADHGGLINVTFSDEDYTIRWTAPYEPNKQVIGLTLSLPEPRRASRLAHDTRKPVYTRPFVVIQGEAAIEVYLPIFAEDRFLGTFGGVYSLGELLEGSASEAVRKNYQVAVEDQEKKRLAFISRRGEGLDGRLRASISLNPPLSGTALNLRAYIKPLGTPIILVISLSVALAAGIALSIWRIHRELITRRRIEEQLRISREEVLDRTRRLEELSRRDPLTDLFNQRAFYEHLHREIAFAERHDFDLCLAYFDLNDFKKVNDTLGHETGNAVLKAVAKATQGAVRENDLCCRYGGDEFCIIMPKTDTADADSVAARIIDRFAEMPNRGVSLSFGITRLGPDDDPEGDALLRRADALMYEAKAASRGGGSQIRIG